MPRRRNSGPPATDAAIVISWQSRHRVLELKGEGDAFQLTLFWRAVRAVRSIMGRETFLGRMRHQFGESIAAKKESLRKNCYWSMFACIDDVRYPIDSSKR